MKRSLLLILVFATAMISRQAIADDKIHIIPEPVEIKTASGIFSFTKDVSVSYPAGNNDLKSIAELFSEQISAPLGYRLKVTGKIKPAGKLISFVLNSSFDSSISKEGYKLSIKPNKIEITSNTPAGLFYGMQTLMQICPDEIASEKCAIHKEWNVPCLSIVDYPRFGWRGLMLDVSRHFFSKEFVKKYIDEMVEFKFNTFHWHLADNDGWRIEIKGLPRLTEVGAWHVKRTGRYGTFDPAAPGEKPEYGGFYTQEDIKEVVKYAQERFVTIVPEIDVPGHSQALIAAYPSVSCEQKPAQVYAATAYVKREPYESANGEFSDDNVICVGNESNYAKLDTIFSQIAALFPGQYIHVGGDEVDKGFWKSCPKCQKRLADEGLKSYEELQSYFIKRIEKILLAKGKVLLGWDEILEGGLAPSAVVMSWRGTEGGIEAAKKGHYVVMTPVQYCYLDYLQGDPVIERLGGGFLRTSRAYEFEPVPDGVDPKFILGGQGNLWTENIPNERRAEYMTWPRGLALAEVYWSPKEKRNWDDFSKRMETQFKRFDKAEINYAPSVYDPVIQPVKASNGDLQVTFSTEIKGLDIYYTFDCTFPDHFCSKAQGKLIDVPRGASEVWAATYRDGKPLGRLMTIGTDELKRRLQ